MAVSALALKRKAFREKAVLPMACRDVSENMAPGATGVNGGLSVVFCVHSRCSRELARGRKLCLPVFVRTLLGIRVTDDYGRVR